MCLSGWSSCRVRSAGAALGLAALCLGLAAPAGASAPALRKWPYPFRAALTINSDLDNCSRQEYQEIHQFLNTKQDASQNAPNGRNTDMGVGVGLEIGDSFWMNKDYNSGGWTFSYFREMSAERSADADLLRAWTQAGYVDVLHSFGDFQQAASFTRELGAAALAEMAKARLNPLVWVNHGGYQNLNNIGAPWSGDQPGSPARHTDLSVAPRGPIRFIGNQPYTSAIGVDKLTTVTLRDGTPAYAFTRYYDNREGWNVEYLHKQISAAHLDQLAQGGGLMIVANHLGYPKNSLNLEPVLGPENREALRELERRYRGGAIYVTTTARLLWLEYIRTHLAFTVEGSEAAGYAIRISGVRDPVYGDFLPTMEEMQGITFYADDPEKTRVWLGAQEMSAQLVMNPADHLGRRSLSFPRTALPPLPEWTTDGYIVKREGYETPVYDYTFDLTNDDTQDFQPTLSYIGLHGFSLGEARAADGTYLIDAPDERTLRLPRLRAGESLRGLRVKNGPYNPLVPRLVGRGNPEVAVASATFASATAQTTLRLEGAGATALALRQCARPFRSARTEIAPGGDCVARAELTSGELTLKTVNLRLAPSGAAVVVQIETWPERGDDLFIWREESAAGVSVRHTIGGLRPGDYYFLKLNGARIDMVLANAAGEASFDYGGGITARQFELAPTSPRVAVELGEFRGE